MDTNTIDSMSTTDSLDELAQATADGAQEQETTELTEEEKYWKNVNENPSDFNSWTYLVQIAERQNDLEKIRRVYDGFLAEFPLCYVYWKKYADHESNHGNIDKAMEVYERGVSSIPHSVDLWTYYCTFVGEKSEDLDYIRGLWERAASIVGTDFVAHLLWDKYIEFEVSQEDFPRVTALYNRILHIPLEQLSQYYEKYKTYANQRPLAELFDATEVQAFEQEKKQQELKYKELSATKEAGESMEHSEVQAAGVKTLDELEMEFRNRISAAREDLYRRTAEEVNKRRPFEYLVLKRPYFHVKPLDEAQLSNWRRYLDMEEKEGDPARVIKLYERCLIACCYYSEFWLRYTNWLEKHRTPDEAREVFNRAVTVHLKRRSDIHLEFAAFEEAYDNIPRARQIYENLGATLPGHVECTLRFASFEWRHQNFEVAASIFESALSILSSDPKSFSFMSMQYARFLERVMKNQARAREVYEAAVQKFPDYKNLWLAYINFEFSQNDSGMENHVHALYARALADDSKLSADDKYDLWQNCLEFAADWGSDIQRFRRLVDSFRAAYPSHKPESKKRGLETVDGLLGASPQAKVARTGSAAAAPASTSATSTPTATTTPAAAAASAQAYSYGYGQYPYAAAGAYQGYAGYQWPAAGYSYPYAQSYQTGS